MTYNEDQWLSPGSLKLEERVGAQLGNPLPRQLRHASHCANVNPIVNTAQVAPSLRAEGALVPFQQDEAQDWRELTDVGLNSPYFLNTASMSSGSAPTRS